ncbi:MAG: 2Fe-2S iron-sulfur cluster-binding protein [Nitrospirae bacterium]|nr:2Fe-2S iron-sulfur cluster-binding protein [Nitrospirota bacterium]
MERDKVDALLVEYDPTHARLIKREIRDFDESIIIEHVSSGEEALELLEKGNRYDLIIMTYDLPKADGIKVLKVIKERYKFRNPVIMLLSIKDEGLKDQAIKEGAALCIIKTEDYTSRIPWEVKDCLRRGRVVAKERVILEYRPEESLVRFKINGQDVVGERGETILDVARRYGIKIPTLCYHSSVSAFGGCRLCVVEVTQRNRTQLHPSCIFPVSNGIIVNTDTERVLKARKMLLELLMARCPDVGLLKDMAEEMGLKKTRFKLRANPDKCILCGLCVRVCEEKIGASAIGFSQRGLHREIGTPFMELSDSCTGCGECAKICPTEAITIEYIDSNIRKKRTTVAVKCDGCAGYENRACVNNCPTGALKVMTIEDYLIHDKESFNIELRELLRYSLEEEAKAEK